MTEQAPAETPIALGELLECIGELYVQTRLLRRMLTAAQQAQAPHQAAQNGVADAVHQQ